MLPLADITVVALEQAVAAPFATRQLADLGARVIKIERPGTGDFARHYDEAVNGLCSYFVWLNRSKESLTLDIKQEPARAIIHQLLDTADVFIQNLAPGTAARLGFEASALRAAHPRLIVCDITGYGATGPYRDKKAYDQLVQCETGVVAVTGTPEVEAKAGISVADIAAGMYAYSGILTALYQRERTGSGTALDVSLFEALGEWMGFPGYYAAYSGAPPPRTGMNHATIAPYGPFAAGDGQQINLAVQTAHEWHNFCAQVLRHPELEHDARFVTNPARVAHRAELHAVISAAFAPLRAEEVVERLDRAGIANGRMNSVLEFWNHPQLRARDRWREVGSPVGTLHALLPPVGMTGMEPRMDPIPAVGEHTEAILRGLGSTMEEIEALRRAGAI